MLNSLRFISRTPIRRCFASQVSPPQLSSESVITKDVFGPINPKSNLRVVKFYIPPDETSSEKEYRLERANVQEWNQQFWAAHNTQYTKEKKAFVKAFLEKKSKDSNEPQLVLTSDDLAVFYKSFLSENLDKHIDYNKEWHKKNFKLLWLGIMAYLSKCKRLMN